MKKKLLKNLRRIRDEGPQIPSSGICANVDYLGTRLPASLLLEWPGSIDPLAAYPVEGSLSVYNRDAAEGTLWKNPRRLALLDWLIDTIEKELLDELAGEDA